MKSITTDGMTVDMARSAGASERSERGTSASALDNSRIMPPPQVKALRLRRQRWERRAESARFLAPLATELETGFRRPVRPARCAWSLGQSVGIMHDGGDRPAGFAGIERCGSIWACPHCAAVIRAGRAAEIEQAVKHHQETVGGSVLFFTGTLRHHQGDQLEVTLDAILEGWRRLTRGRPWKRIKEKYQVSGYIRSIEVTLGASSWHPHAHVLLFLDADISPGQLEELRPTLYELWATCVEKAGGKRPTEKGLDLQKLDDDGKLLARYLGKVQDEKQGWSAGAELARGDVKSGRGSSITPHQLLDEHPDYDEQTRARLWREFYLVSKGRRAITWSRGLKERCLIAEVTDADILDEMEQTVMVWRTSSKSYRAVLRSEPVLLAVALELAEHEKWAQLAEILPRDDVPPDQRE